MNSEMTYCTGFGGSDTHSPILSDGRINPHPSAGQPYGTISLNDIVAMAANPPTMNKGAGQWIIPSTYHEADARNHAVQTERGFYTMLVADIDEGNPSLETINGLLDRALGEHTARLIYSSRSATADNRKWRIMIPLAGGLTGQQYGAYQAAFFDALEHGKLTPDRALERPGQLIYLPNRGDYYEQLAGGTELYTPHPIMMQWAELYMASREIPSGEGKERQEGRMSHLRAFREKHSIVELMRLYGYQQQGSHWRSPLQTSPSFATRVRDDHWYSLSQSDAAAGLGRPSAKGGRYGDAFDLYVHFNCKGDRAAAEAYAMQCLKEEQARIFGAATAEHGAATWEAINLAKQKAAEEAASKLHLEVDESLLNSDEWTIPWPPGEVGQLAKWIYLSSSRPIKQYAIAAALYFYSVGGRKYNIDGAGLNLFILMIGITGRGKGVVKTSLDRLLAAVTADSKNPSLSLPFAYEIPVSESGMRKALQKQNPICLYEEELGLTLLPLTSLKASANDIGLRKILTRLYDSGEGKMLGRKEASDQDRTRDVVYMPCMTLAGDTQPHIYRSLLGNSMIDSGFGPRMVPFFYYGLRKHHNEDSINYRMPPEALVTTVRLYLEYCLTSGETINHVQWGEGVPEKHRAFGYEMDDLINKDTAGVEMFNRAATTVARIAAVLAVGKSHIAPVIDMECYDYAQMIVRAGLDETRRILEEGGAGAGESVRMFKLRDAVRKFIKGEIKQETKTRVYKTPKAILDKNVYVNEGFLLAYLGNQQDFKGGELRTTEHNVRETIKEALAQGLLELATGLILDKRTKQAIYQVGPDF